MNEYSKIITKRKILEKYKEVILTALEQTVELLEERKQILNQLASNESNLEKVKKIIQSKKPYLNLIDKIKNNQILEEKDYSYIAIALTTASHRMITNADKLTEAAKQCANLSKAFLLNSNKYLNDQPNQEN